MKERKMSIRLQAASWLTLYKEQAMTPEEEDRLDGWLAEDMEQRYEYEMLADAWDMLGSISDEPEILAMRKQYHGRVSPLRRLGRRLRKQSWGAIAASALLAVAGTWWALSAGNSGIANRTYQTAASDLEEIHIGDDALITLDGNAMVSVDRNWGEVVVSVEYGRVLVQALSPTRKVLVTAGGLQAVADGASLNVANYGGEVTFTAVEGTLQVAARTTAGSALWQQDLQAGQAVAFDLAADGAPHLREVNVKLATSWLRGEVYYEAASLETVVADMSRYANGDVTVLSESESPIYITGLFSTRDFEAFLQSLTEIAPVTIERGAADAYLLHVM